MEIQSKEYYWKKNYYEINSLLLIHMPFENLFHEICLHLKVP